MFIMLLLMLAGHALADYPLQGDFLAKAKNHKLTVIPNETIWPWALTAHASIHGALVGLITGIWWLGVAEFVVHTIIDYAKSDGRLTFAQDQALHIGFKFVWIAVIIAFL